MKRKCLLTVALLAMLLCACKAEPAPPTTPPETQPTVVTATEQTGDIELKRMEAEVKDGRTLTLSVLGKQEPDGMRAGVRVIHVYEGETQIQEIVMEEAIQADGVNGLDIGYTECFSPEEAAALKDVNFDGYPDIEVCGWTPNNAIPYYYWCWDPEAEQFTYAFSLQLREADTENRQLVAWYKVENGLYYTDYYRVNSGNVLELVKRETEDVRP